jgi:uncharacterized protein
MSIDWSAFTPGSALAGGALIGLATAMLVLLNGRIAGISGVLGGLLGGLLKPSRTELLWRIAFIAGLIFAPRVYALLSVVPAVQIEAGYGGLIAAGLLVGAGTRYAGGCTSGHGVCGLSRLSPRSLVATATFMGAGFMTVLVMRHLLNI